MLKALLRSNRTRPGSSRRAFSIVELMIVVAIIGLVAGLSVAGWRSVQSRKELERARFCFGALNAARTQYLGEHPFIDPSEQVDFTLIAPYLATSKENKPESLEAFTAGTGEGRVWILDAWNVPIACKPPID